MRACLLAVLIGSVLAPGYAAARAFTNGDDDVCLLNSEGVPSYCTGSDRTPVPLGNDWTFQLLDGADQLVVRSTSGCSCTCDGSNLSSFSYPGGRVLNVIGGRNNDHIYGGPGPDKFFGDDSANLWTVFDGAGDDALYGSGGNDTFFGCHGYDQLFGGTGTDYLHGQDDDFDCLTDADNSWSSCDCGPGDDFTTEDQAACIWCENAAEACTFFSCPSGNPWP